MYYILIIISVLAIIFSNFFSRVDFFPTIIYDNFPEKFKLKNKNMLKLYIIYPKSLITKSGFISYISTIIMFFIAIILNILYYFNIINFDLTILIIIYSVVFVLVEAICGIFDNVIYHIYKYKKKN